MKKEEFLKRMKKEFPDAQKNDTNSYTSFKVKNSNGKLQNFIEIHFQKEGIKIGIMSKCLNKSELEKFDKKPASHRWTLDAEYVITSEEKFNEILPYINKSYLFIKGEGSKEIKMPENIDKYKNILLSSQNIILRGAPGTGKTYLAKEIAKEITGSNEDQIGFVQFHPSYDYTDFVEGLRPVSNVDGAIEFRLQDGIFKQFCQKAKEAQKTGGQDNFEETWAKLTDAINEKQGQYFFPRSSVPASLNSQGNVKFDSPVATKEKVYLLYKGEETNLKYETYQKIVLDHMKESYGLCD